MEFRKKSTLGTIFNYILGFLLVLLLLALLTGVIVSLYNVYQLNTNGVKTKKTYDHCECRTEYECHCCFIFRISRYNSPHEQSCKVCSIISYVPNEYEVSAALFYNDTLVFKQNIEPVKSPLPLCIDYFDKDKLELCLGLFDLDVKYGRFSGCVDYKIKFYDAFIDLRYGDHCFGY